MVFSSRRAIERLRDGLFDPVAVSRLSIQEEQVQTGFLKGLKSLEKGESDHLCICGSYGQGKSHAINYLSREALSQGYATSLVQLDIREVPFHQFPGVYRAVMEGLSLPQGECFIHAWKRLGKLSFLEKLPELPHRFRMILTGMLQEKNKTAEKPRELHLKPKEASALLEQALTGHEIPLVCLKSILHNREVDGYHTQSLLCKGALPYVQMVQVLGKLLKEMGYKGLVLFFDEAESITQGRVNQRVKSYAILDEFFNTKASVYPVFAFTDDFFQVVNGEQYDDEKKTFPVHYADRWRQIKIARLQAFLSKEWGPLQHRLIDLYAEAYQLPLLHQKIEIQERLQKLLNTLKIQDIRLKMRAMVHQLDMETQHHFLKN